MRADKALENLSHYLMAHNLFNEQSLVFRNQDLNETQSCVADIFKPHDLKACNAKIQSTSSMYHMNCGNLSISRLEYGMDVVIEPDCLEKFYLIQIPIAGHAQIEFQNEKFVSYSQLGSIISPDLPIRMTWAACSPQITLKIPKQNFLQHCRQHLPESQQNALIFDPKLDLNSTNSLYFFQLYQNLLDSTIYENHPLNHPLVSKEFESNLYNALIYGQQHNLSSQFLRTDKNIISPYFVKNTQEFIEAHIHEALSIELLAEHAGVSVRTLFLGFKKFLGTTPMAYLKEQRFQNAHLDLIRSEHLSITEIAFKWGFTHLGRFSQEYKQRFGHLPSSIKRKI
ncbi:AraC family transcriptional regulator [Acinetobacter gerneri]|jgi:AraC-like DNA-binding protein|uniref:AraC family transcriptional regulator n=1 Tax=Acinetobacter gerneri TaxID=202952 RepID=UPI0023EF5E71|nr:AraC family transcriptional regulator [Acinetobacter gerneri]MCH4245721.1 AraC family transcriptional regulator [Acinetobacter gerneri]